MQQGPPATQPLRENRLKKKRDPSFLHGPTKNITHKKHIHTHIYIYMYTLTILDYDPNI